MARRLTVLAGSGALVPQVVDAARALGDKVQVLALTPRPDIAGVKVAAADIRNPVALLWSLKTFRTTHVVMAGAISISDKVREELSKFAGKNGVETNLASAGDAEMSGLARAVKKVTGAELIAVQDIAPDLVAGAGLLAGPEPSPEGWQSARFALEAARKIGRLDLGQAVVAAGLRLIAAEDIAGTDDLLARVARYRAEGLAGDGGGVLVLAKAAKPQQPLFLDLPAIGAGTIANAAAAGIRVIAIEAGRTLLLERAELVAAANDGGISVLGLAAGDG